MLKVSTLHTGDTHRADLFLVSQDAHCGLGGGGDGEQSFQLSISTDTVVMAVGTQQAPVQTYLAALAGGNQIQLSRQEVGLGDAVALIEKLQNVQLHQVGTLTLQRLGAQDHVQLLACNDLCSGLLHLITCQMDQQIGDHQNGVVSLFADGDGNVGAVLQADNAVQCQLHGGPLVLLDAAVVVGLKVCDLGILIQGIGFQVQTGGVHVSGADIGTLCQGLGADHSQSDGLVAIIVVDLVTGLSFHTGGEGLEAVLLSLGDGPGGCFALSLGCVHECHVALGIGVHFLTLFGGDTGIAVLVGSKQGTAQFFGSHKYLSFYG